MFMLKFNSSKCMFSSGGSRISRRGGHGLVMGGRGPPMWVLFTKNVCKMTELGPIGGVDLQCGHFPPKMYVKIKELGPVGGACANV